jgi:hypothetical protein
MSFYIFNKNFYKILPYLQHESVKPGVLIWMILLQMTSHFNSDTLIVKQYCPSRWFKIWYLMVAGYRTEICSKYLNLVIKFELLGTNWSLFPFIWIHNRMYKPVSPLTFYSVCQVIAFRNVSPLPELFLPELRAQPSRPRDFTISTIQDGTTLHPTLTFIIPLDPHIYLHIWLQIQC